MERKVLEELGLTKEQIDKVCDMHHGEMTPLKTELQKTKDDLQLANGKVEETSEKLKGLEGLDKEGYEEQIKKLKEDLKQKDVEHSSALSERDFNELLKDSIASPEIKGKNAKAITALLDIDVLKASKNQKEDLAAALKTLAEKEDSKMLFGDSEPNPVGTGNLIGAVTKPTGEKPTTLKDALSEKYKK